MNENLIVSAIIQSRRAYESIAGSLDHTDFSEYPKMVLKYADAYYRNDPEAQSIDSAIVASALQRHFASPKQADRAVKWLEALPASASADNVAAEYRLLQRHNVALELAGRLGTGQHDERTDALLTRYMQLSLPVELQRESERLSLEQLEQSVGDGTRIQLLPGVLNDAIGGGVLRGHNITIFGRPESGKTLLAINMGSGFPPQGLRVLHTGNEEPLRDLHYRYLSRLSRIPIGKIMESKEALCSAQAKAEDRGWQNIILKELVTARLGELEEMVSRYEPDVLIIDQLKNLKMNDKSGNRALELDNIAQEIRRLGKQYQMVTIPVTQAGNEGDNKLVLEQGDVEWSNTGIPGAADLMIGNGVNEQYAVAKRRMISLCKNKINGNKTYFPVFIEPQYSAMLSKPLRSD